ncbi:MAG: rane protein [Paenibacillus sp.]|jgi:holin-like protein|nr:rane protein [Paenibacillus sp.]
MKLLAELSFLCMLYGFSAGLTQWLSLPVPPVLTGMLLFLLLLMSGLIKTEQFERSTRFFSKHFVLFFIPAVVGIMQYWGILQQGGWQLMFIIAASTVTVLISTAVSAMLFHRGEKHDDP